MKDLIALLSKIVEYCLKPTRRKAGFSLIGFGVALITSGGLAGKFQWWNGTQAISIQIDASVSSVVICLGAFLIVGGFVLIFFTPQTKRSAFAIAHLGMDDVLGGNALIKAASKFFELDPQDVITIDQSAYQDMGYVTEPDKALNELLKLNVHLEQKKGNFDELVYGGLAPVPFLFTAGVLLSSRNSVSIFDWDRHKREWHNLTANKKGFGLRFCEEHLHDKEKIKSIAIAIPITFAINEADIKHAIGDVPLITAQLIDGNEEQPIKTPDLLSSEEDQIRCAKDFELFLNALHGYYPNVGCIHLFISSQASFVFRLGRQLLPKNHGEVVIYQFSKGHKIVYPWGVKIPLDAPPQLQLNDERV